MHKNRKTKTLMAVLMATSMTATSVVNSFSIVKAQENVKEGTSKVVELKVETKEGLKDKNDEQKQLGVTVNNSISVMIDYFNNNYYKKDEGKLTGWEYVAMKKAGEDLSKWKLDCAMMFYGKPDELKTIASKAKQSIILMELDKDPSEYEGRNLIKEMADEMAKEVNNYTGNICNEMKAILAIDEFNEKFPDKKVDYDVEAWIKIFIGNQNEKDGNIGNIGDTGYAIELLSKHEDIEGAKKAKEKALDYIKSNLHYDGGIYTRSFSHKSNAELVRELVKAGEDPISDQWTKNEKNIIDGLFENWNGEKFVKSNGRDAKYDFYTEALYTLAVLKEKGYGDYVLKGVEFNNLGKGNKDNISVEEIKLDNTFVEIEDGKTLQLEATIKPENATNKNVEWSSSNEDIARVSSNGRIFAKKQGEAIITATTEDGKKKATCTVKVNIKESDKPKTDEKYKILIKKNVEDLKEYYEVKDKYNYIQCMSFNLLGVDKNILKDKFQLREDEVKGKSIYLFDNEVEMTAKNIMGIIAIGENPKDYKGVNYVEKLKKSQNELGEFIIEKSDIDSQAYSIIALDIANEKYDVGNAIKILMEKYKTEDKLNVENISNTIVALSVHNHEAGVEEFIKNCVKDIKELQNKLETGGVAYRNGITGSDETPVYDARAIQALISIGENPLSNEYKKDNKTILDGMMKFKKENYFILDPYSECYPALTDEASGMALASLMDLNKNKSMYHLIGEKYKEQLDKEKEDAKEFEISLVNPPKYFNLDKDANVTAEVKNNSKEVKEATLIIALYDKEEKMVNYSLVHKHMKPGEINKIAGGFTLPKEGKYKVKVFVWDNLKNMKALSKVKVIEVK